MRVATCCWAGGGDDRLLGGRGFDTLYAGEGADVLVGGFGRDVLFSRAADGVADTLICGPGRDVAYARPEDTVARDCEKVTVLPAADATTDPGDEDTAPPVATVGDDGSGDGGGDPAE